jgi:hypothetical protein
MKHLQSFSTFGNKMYVPNYLTGLQLFRYIIETGVISVEETSNSDMLFLNYTDTGRDTITKEHFTRDFREATPDEAEVMHFINTNYGVDIHDINLNRRDIEEYIRGLMSKGVVCVIKDVDGVEYIRDNTSDFKKGNLVAMKTDTGYEVKRIAFRKDEKDPFRDKTFAEVYFEGEIGKTSVVGLGTGWFKVKPV